MIKVIAKIFPLFFINKKISQKANMFKLFLLKSVLIFLTSHSVFAGQIFVINGTNTDNMRIPVRQYRNINTHVFTNKRYRGKNELITKAILSLTIQEFCEVMEKLFIHKSIERIRLSKVKNG